MDNLHTVADVAFKGDFCAKIDIRDPFSQSTYLQNTEITWRFGSYQFKEKRKFPRYINKRVLIEWVRITGLDNKAKWKLDRLVAYLANIITGYSANTDNAFSWPTYAGVSGNIPAYRAKVSYKYWKYFMAEERRKPADYNKEHGTKIAIIKEEALWNQNSNNLGYLYASNRLSPPAIDYRLRNSLKTTDIALPQYGTTKEYEFD
ncbi:hypothetical protein COOONC_05523 [Cooperia oncophora]